MRRKISLLMVLTAAASLIISISAFSEQYGVVRKIQGGGFVQGSQDGQTQSLGMNVPIMEGDNVWTDGGGQMDIVLPDGNHLWVDVNTRIEFDQLPSDDASEARPLRARLWKGDVLLDVRIWIPAMADYVIATPSASLSPTASGLFLAEVESVDRTRVTCLDGACVVASAGAAVDLAANQMTYADYGYPPLSPVQAEQVSTTLLKFRQENQPRRVSGGASQKYLPSNLYAYSDDLDANGNWSYTEDYGYVWRPTYVAADWAPYTYGSWAWEPWGATWCPFDAWGWAPFHYGRWCFNAGIGWGWCPMPYFAPAWVDWYWDDAGWVGWCPLGFYGGPLWGPCGWNSCSVGNFYGAGWNHGCPYEHHHNPPPQPIVPNVQGTPGVLHGGSPRGSGATIPRLNLPPTSVTQLQQGRISSREVRSQLTQPVSTRTRGSYPSVQPNGRGMHSDVTRPVENPNMRTTTPRSSPPSDGAIPSRGATSVRPPAGVEGNRSVIDSSPSSPRAVQPRGAVDGTTPVQPRGNTGDSGLSPTPPRAYSNEGAPRSIQPRPAQPSNESGAGRSTPASPGSSSGSNPAIQPRPALPSTGSGHTNTNPSSNGFYRQPTSRGATPEPWNGGQMASRQPIPQRPSAYQSPRSSSNPVPSRQPSGMSVPRSYARPSTSSGYNTRSVPPSSYSRPAAPQGYTRSAPSMGYSRPYSSPGGGRSTPAPSSHSSAPSVSHSAPAPSFSGGGGGGGHHHH